MSWSDSPIIALSDYDSNSWILLIIGNCSIMRSVVPWFPTIWSPMFELTCSLIPTHSPFIVVWYWDWVPFLWVHPSMTLFPPHIATNHPSFSTPTPQTTPNTSDLPSISPHEFVSPIHPSPIHNSSWVQWSIAQYSSNETDYVPTTILYIDLIPPPIT